MRRGEETSECAGNRYHSDYPAAYTLPWLSTDACVLKEKTLVCERHATCFFALPLSTLSATLSLCSNLSPCQSYPLVFFLFFFPLSFGWKTMCLPWQVLFFLWCRYFKYSKFFFVVTINRLFFLLFFLLLTIFFSSCFASFASGCVLYHHSYYLLLPLHPIISVTFFFFFSLCVMCHTDLRPLLSCFLFFSR